MGSGTLAHSTPAHPAASLVCHSRDALPLSWALCSGPQHRPQQPCQPQLHTHPLRASKAASEMIASSFDCARPKLLQLKLGKTLGETSGKTLGDLGKNLGRNNEPYFSKTHSFTVKFSPKVCKFFTKFFTGGHRVFPRFFTRFFTRSYTRLSKVSPQVFSQVFHQAFHLGFPGVRIWFYTGISTRLDACTHTQENAHTQAHGP